MNKKALNADIYRERIDFGEPIGYHVSEKNPDIQEPTTKGIIHYSKQGSHIVPANPNVEIDKECIDVISLRLSTMRSLWGVITENVRKVSIKEQNHMIYLHFYYDKEPSEEEVELSEDAATEVIADFSEPFMITCKRAVINYPEKINNDGFLVYSRFEKSI